MAPIGRVLGVTLPMEAADEMHMGAWQSRQAGETDDARFSRPQKGRRAGRVSSQAVSPQLPSTRLQAPPTAASGIKVVSASGKLAG